MEAFSTEMLIFDVKLVNVALGAARLVAPFYGGGGGYY